MATLVAEAVLTPEQALYLAYVHRAVFAWCASARPTCTDGRAFPPRLRAPPTPF